MEPVYILVVVAALILVAFFVLRKKEPALPAEVEDEAHAPESKGSLPQGAPTEAEAAEAAGERAPSDEPQPVDRPPPSEAPSAEVSSAPASEVAQPSAPASIPPPRAGAEDVSALRKGLGATRGGIIAKLRGLFSRTPAIDPSVLDEVEEILLTSDVGVSTTQRILDALRAGMNAGEITSEDAVWSALRREALTILESATPSAPGPGSPTVILFVGVNGVGKTTTIGKLASKYVSEGRSVLLVAGDTYRAAAVIQLEVWGKRVGCEIAKGRDRADPSAVVFDAVKRAKDEGIDVVLCDTAGRLQTKTPLMDELAKIGRTIEKALGRPADEVLLVLDSTNGQNAVSQAQQFKEACSVSGVVLTKLDGTARGGVVLGIVDTHRMPVRYVGIGERVEDLRPFDAATFVDALFDQSDEDVNEASD